MRFIYIYMNRIHRCRLNCVSILSILTSELTLYLNYFLSFCVVVYRQNTQLFIDFVRLVFGWLVQLRTCVIAAHSSVVTYGSHPVCVTSERTWLVNRPWRPSAPIPMLVWPKLQPASKSSTPLSAPLPIYLFVKEDHM